MNFIERKSMQAQRDRTATYLTLSFFKSYTDVTI